MTEERYLEDFVVGQTFSTGRIRVEADDIKNFAARFDPQPFHLDEAAASASLFAGLAGSGWHTAALTMRLLVDAPVKPVGGLIGAGGEIAWPHPLRPGDELHVEAEIVEVRPSRSHPERGLIKLRLSTLNQAGEAVQILIATLVVPRRVPAALDIAA